KAEYNTKRGGRGLYTRHRVSQRGDEAVGVLDPDTDTERAFGDAEARPLLRCDAAVRRDRRVKHFGEEITQRRRRRRELERVEEPERGRLVRFFEIERHDTTEEAAELTLRELVLRMRCQAGIPHTRDLR